MVSNNDFFNWCGDTNTIVSKKHRLTCHCERMLWVTEYVSDRLFARYRNANTIV